MSEPAERRFRIVGNLLCLDLVNTEPTLDGNRIDALAQFSDVIAWLSTVGVLSKREAQKTEARWEGTAEGDAMFAATIELRTGLRTMAERIVAREPVNDIAVNAINRILASRPGHRQLLRKDHAFRTKLVPQSEDPIHFLVPVAESAAELLEHGKPKLIRRCENPSCVLYFYDTTKNRSRRWCSMEVCGSRFKSAAYYRRGRVHPEKGPKSRFRKPV